MVTTPVDASSFKRTLKGRLDGAWVVLRVEAWSSCAGAYTDNRVSSGAVASAGDVRFPVGELGKVEGVQVKRRRIDLKISLSEPVLVPYMDGPFELLDERFCKVEMEVEVPREQLRAKDIDAVLERVQRSVELHATLAEAHASDVWNERQRAPYPADYELTLARHARWQAEQTNAAVADRIRQALDDAARMTAAVDTNPDYLQGFAAGARTMQEWWERDCGDLIGAQFRFEGDRPPSARSAPWVDGWDDGQELVFNILLAQRLEGCFVPVPEVPADAGARR
jgi:hypothetical protein